MAPVPDQSNWLTFSLYPPMEMMRSSNEPDHLHHNPQQLDQQQNNHNHFLPNYEAAASSPQYLFDNFYANGYSYSKPQMDFHQSRPQHSVSDSLPFLHQQSVPKLENFLDSASMVRYTESQTDTQDSTLTHMYDHGQGQTAGYFHNGFSANSGSEVADSGLLNRAQLVEFESGDDRSLIGFSQKQQQQQPGHNGGLSLGVNNNSNNNCGTDLQRTVEEDKSLAAVVDSGKKVSDTFGQRTSIYRGVTRHRWTGRYEAHLWDNSCRREGQARKGRQVYLGGYDKEDKAARAYDLAALKYWGPTATTNFPVANYSKELEEMKPMTKQEFIASLRRKSSGFSRGASIYRGVTRHHQQGRWQARIGRVAGNKDLYLGTFATEEEAAEAYDIAAIKFRGINAVTNFEMNRYDVEAITNSTLPVGGGARRLKSTLESEQRALVSVALSEPRLQNTTNNISFSLTRPMSTVPCGIPFDAVSSLYQQNIYHQLQANHAAAQAISESQNSVNSSGATTGPVTYLPTQAEYYGWPHHQSY
ncbi:hypothetical protein QQ045_010187 [Rhodiola kirilowii]